MLEWEQVAGGLKLESRLGSPHWAELSATQARPRHDRSQVILQPAPPPLSNHCPTLGHKSSQRGPENWQDLCTSSPTQNHRKGPQVPRAWSDPWVLERSKVGSGTRVTEAHLSAGVITELSSVLCLHWHTGLRGPLKIGSFNLCQADAQSKCQS